MHVVESHRAGDRDLASFGPSSNVEPCREKLFLQPAHSQALPGAPDGDRDSVNSARPMRTRFYSARKTQDGNKTVLSGDCVEVNSTAMSARFAPVRRLDRFHRDKAKQYSTTVHEGGGWQQKRER
jgi:hypothetical protein